MKITKLEYQKENKGRVNVYVDGKFAAGIEEGDVLTLNLFKDKEITQEELNKIITQSEFGKMLNFALNYLSFRPRSEWEVRTHLKRKYGTDSGPGQNDVLEKLKQIRQIDDEAFARWFVEQRNTFRPKGKRILEQELRRKGIKPEIIKEALQGDDNSEFEKAYLLLAKKFQISNFKFQITDQKSKDKMIRFLLSRGFSWEIVEDVLAKLKKGE